MRPTLALACFLVALPTVLSTPSAAEPAPNLATRKTGTDWPRFLGPTGESKSSEKILKTWPRGGLEVRWFMKVGEGYSAPSVSKGRLFMFDRLRDKARLLALHSETGEELWRSEYTTKYEDMYGYSSGPRTTPVVDDDRVYVFGVEGRLRAHDVATGKLLWEVDTQTKFNVQQNFFGVGSTPVIEGDLLITQVGGSPEDSPGIQSGEVKGNGSGIVAFDKRTGKVRYQVTDELAAYASPTLTTLGDRRWGFMFTRGGLVAFEPTTGKTDFFYPWRAKILESVNAATPVVVSDTALGDTVFITECYGPGSSLLKVKPGGYEVLWKDPPRGKSMESHWSTPIHHEGYLYGSSGRNPGNAELRCLEHATGKVMWSQQGLRRSTLLYADGHFLVLGEYGELSLIKATPEKFDLVARMDLGGSSAEPGADPDSGPESAETKTAVDDKPALRPRLRHPTWNAPVLAHGLLYLRGKDQLICLNVFPEDD